MDLNLFINTILNVSTIFKAFALVFSFMYMLYSFIVWRQIPIMNESYISKTGHILALFALVQFVVSILTFLLAIFLL